MVADRGKDEEPRRLDRVVHLRDALAQILRVRRQQRCRPRRAVIARVGMLRGSARVAKSFLRATDHPTRAILAVEKIAEGLEGWPKQAACHTVIYKASDPPPWVW